MHLGSWQIYIVLVLFNSRQHDVKHFRRVGLWRLHHGHWLQPAAKWDAFRLSASSNRIRGYSGYSLTARICWVSVRPQHLSSKCTKVWEIIYYNRFFLSSPNRWPTVVKRCPYWPLAKVFRDFQREQAYIMKAPMDWKMRAAKD